MKIASTDFRLRLAQNSQDIKAVQRLRYDVFVDELGSDGPMVDHDARLECDQYDAHCDHMLLEHKGDVVGTYRLMRAEHAAAAGQFYCADEYDLTLLLQSNRPVLELGRSCIAPQWRGGIALHMIWKGLAEYVAQHDIEILFGVASFHGTDVDALAHPLALLNRDHLAPEALRVRAHPYQRLDLIAEDDIDRRQAMRAMPPLIKSYLRLGGKVGDGAFVDHSFNTTDVMMIMDTDALNDTFAARFRE